MTKIKLTKEQAGAIELFIRWNGSKGLLLQAHSMDSNQWMNSFQPLNQMPIQILAKALYVGYEVEPEQRDFHAGDKIIDTSDEISRLTIVDEVKPGILHGRDYITNFFVAVNFSRARHATNEEIYWLETLSRKRVGDFKLNDIYVDNSGEALKMGEDNDNDVNIKSVEKWYVEGDFKGLYPAESFKPFTKEESR